MSDSYVSKVLVSSKGVVVAIDIYDTISSRHRMQTWDWQTGQMLAEFETVFDGSSRLTISPAGDVLFAGNWKSGKKGGVAAYDATSGRLLWHRSDISETQSLHYSHSGEAVWCSTEKGPVQSLSALTGEMAFAWETIRNAFDSPYAARWLAERKADYVLAGELNITIPRLTSFLFQAAFTPNSVCLAEARGPLRCLEADTGEERWRYSSAQGHVTQLSYHVDGFLYGVLFLSQEGEDSKLLRFALDSGATEKLYHEAERGPDAWSMGQGVLITRSGNVISLESGDVIRRLAISVDE
jgi:outer membrane protein assembly factor BamB